MARQPNTLASLPPGNLGRRRAAFGRARQPCPTVDHDEDTANGEKEPNRFSGKKWKISQKRKKEARGGRFLKKEKKKLEVEEEEPDSRVRSVGRPVQYPSLFFLSSVPNPKVRSASIHTGESAPGCTLAVLQTKANVY